MKILIVDDNGNERKFLRLNLEHHGIKNVVEAGDGVEGLEMARLHRPDLIISDGLMPRMDGFQFLRQIKADDALKSIPFLFYSAVYTGYREVELATSLGAEAFIVKPKEPQELWNELCVIVDRCMKEKAQVMKPTSEEEDFLRAYSHIVTVKLEEKIKELTAEINARKSAQDQVQHDALHDSLTGLPNRALFMDRLAHSMAMAQRRKDFIYAVLYVGLDRFKFINDSLGHICGDLVLIALGNRLKSCIRPHDTVARLGGDEFAIFLEDIMGLGNATFIAERIGTVMQPPCKLAKREVFATVSIGIALSSRAYERPDEVLRDAHTAMNEAKTGGGAKYVIFEPGMHADAVERLRLETDLRRAIERNELVVFYQPIYLLTSNELVGFEALVRWRHPERGLLNPGDFIQMAEDTGMIVSIDRLVLREACRQMRDWMTEFPGQGLAFISANVSNKQMVQPDLVEYVAETVRETGLNPESLKLEITENVIIENPEEAVAVLSRLKALGIKLYIDDFGTGYSSLSYLHLLPIDGLKIDRFFVGRMGEHGENQDIVKTIINLARDMNIGVIAEGVETASQLEQIREMNCAYGQGYLFSKPVDGVTARDMLKKREVASPRGKG